MDPLPGLGCCRGALVAHLSNAWGVVARSFPFPLFGEGHEMLLSLGSWDFCPLVSRDAHGLFPSSCLDWCFIFSWCETSSWEEDCSRCGNKRKGATVLISSVWRSFYSWACDLQWRTAAPGLWVSLPVGSSLQAHFFWGFACCVTQALKECGDWMHPD